MTEIGTQPAATTLGVEPSQAAGQPASPPAGQPAPDAWLGGLPDDLRSSPTLLPYKGKGVDAIIRDHLGFTQKFGDLKSYVKIPAADAKPEERDAFHKATGRPDAADKYDLPKLEGLPDLHPEISKAVREVAFKEGVSGNAMKGLYTAFMTAEDKAYKALEAEQLANQQKSLDTLKQEWGAQYAERSQLAGRAVSYLTSKMGKEGAAFREFLNKSGIGDHPVMIRAFEGVGKILSEDKGFAGATAAGVGFTTGAEMALASFTADQTKQAALYDRNHPKHAAVVAEKAQLYKDAYPTPAQH